MYNPDGTFKQRKTVCEYTEIIRKKFPATKIKLKSHSCLEDKKTGDHFGTTLRAAKYTSPR